MRYIDKVGMGNRLWTSLAPSPTSATSVDSHSFSCRLTMWMQFLREAVRMTGGGDCWCWLAAGSRLAKWEQRP